MANRRAECILVSCDITTPGRDSPGTTFGQAGARYVAMSESGSVSFMSFSVTDKTFKHGASMRLSTTCGGDAQQGVAPPPKRRSAVGHMCLADCAARRRGSCWLGTNPTGGSCNWLLPRARLLGGNAHGGLGLATAPPRALLQAIWRVWWKTGLIADVVHCPGAVPRSGSHGGHRYRPPRTVGVVASRPCSALVPCTALCFSPAVAELAFGTSDGCVGLV